MFTFPHAIATNASIYFGSALEFPFFCHETGFLVCVYCGRLLLALLNKVLR